MIKYDQMVSNNFTLTYYGMLLNSSSPMMEYDQIPLAVKSKLVKKDSDRFEIILDLALNPTFDEKSNV